MALLGWIDFSKADYNRVGSVLDLLRPEGMVDELGIGTIRDALANQLFPGISTIQTRAKYFFIVPYILHEYQLLKPAQRKGKKPTKFLEDREYEIMWQLAKEYAYEEGHGVIGITKRKPQKIVRRPSAIYWNGINTFQFLDARGLPPNNFLNQAVSSTVESLLSVSQGDDGNSDDADADYENIFRIKISPKPKWTENLSLELLKDEAEFFNDRIVSIAKKKLIAELLQNAKLWEVFTAKDIDYMSFVKAASSVPLPAEIKSMMVLAHDFSELMYGAHLAYNCQLQEKVFQKNYLGKDWKEWAKNIETNMLDYNGFNLEVLFAYALTTKRTTKDFVRQWWQLAQNGFNDLEKRDALIQTQESLAKGGKARLRWGKTEDVKEKKWIGLTTFDYRFSQARTILTDIKKGIKN